jgi:tetratricopeptide (TPR) repeat protein
MKLLFSLLFAVLGITAFSQDLNAILKEADAFEKQQKEADAIDRYKQALLIDPSQLKPLVKLVELNVISGNIQTEKNSKRLYYETALSYAKRAIETDANNADANYAMAMASGKMTDVETDNKKLVAFVKDVKFYAEKALSINPNHGKANYTLGKWHYEMTNLSGIKKVAVKLFYGGLPDGKMELAIQYMEKCKSIEMYFAANYLDLAKAYKDDHKPSQAIEVLNKLVKLPTRTSEDPAIKAEGAKLLESLQ